MSQTFLDENPPIVLDATCSTKKIWPRFASLRMDIKREVKPDICASAEFLPFREGVFSEIYCDPPHMIRSDTSLEKQANAWKLRHPRLIRESSGYIRIRSPDQVPRAVDLLRFGAWKSREEWLEFIQRSNSEFARTLSSRGLLHYKIASGKDKRMTQISDMEGYSAFKETRRKILKSRAPWSKNLTYFLTMRLKP